jgi:hypothetical protein
MEDNRNLIQFPADRVKRKTKTGKADFKTIAQDPRKAGAVASILSIMALAFYMNPMAQQQLALNVSDRTPQNYFERTPELEKKLEDEFLNKGSRYPSSLGREPSTEDRLRVGDLHGRYRLVYKDEYVFEIALIESDGSASEPIVLSDRKEFLERYKKIIHPSYDAVEPDLGITSSLREERFKLMKKGQVVGLANIKLDKFGRFYSMKVE